MVYYLFDNVGKNFNVSHYAHVYCHTHLKKYFVLLLGQFTKRFVEYNVAYKNSGKSSG